MKIRKDKPRDAKECMKIAKLDKVKHWKEEDFSRAARDRNAIFLVAEEGGISVQN